jgi:hypothetical protein
MTDDSVALWRAAGRRGWAVERLTRFRPPDGFGVAGRPVLYVEALTAPLFAEALRLRLVEPATDAMPNLPARYRGRAIRLASLGEARRSLVEAAFVKPPNDKSFKAGVYRGTDLPAEFADDSPVLVQEIVRWRSEFRCFVLDRQVWTWSVYDRDDGSPREDGYAHTPGEADAVEAFMRSLLADPGVTLPRACVVDVGQLLTGEWAVVELNAAWGAGLYGCDPDAALDVLYHAVEPECDLR